MSVNDLDGIANVAYSDNPVLATPPDESELYAWYDIDREDFGDGDTISSLTDQSGNGRDLSGSSGRYPTATDNAINGNQAAYFDPSSSGGGGDYLSTDWSNESQPNTYFIVYRWNNVNDSIFTYVYAAYDENTRHDHGQWNEGNDIGRDAGNITDRNANSLADTNPALHTAVYDSGGGNSVGRLNQSQYSAQDPGGNDSRGIVLGNNWTTRLDRPGDIYIGELLVYPSDKTAKVSDIEQYLVDKWGPF